MEIKQEKTGFCGLYCGCCTIYRAHQDDTLHLLKEAPKNFRQWLDLENKTTENIACDGCRSSKPFAYCADCEIRECAIHKQVDWCFQCDEFPCDRIYSFESFWGKPLIGNLNSIRELDIKKWIEKQEKDWACGSCGTKLHWFSYGICHRCGFNSPDLGSL